MATHVDILEQRQEGLKRPLVVSLAVHAGLFVTVAVYTNIGMHGVRAPWGDPRSLGGGSVGISAVKQLALPSRSGAPNPLANDTESRVPAPPKPEAVKRTRMAEDPDAIALRGRTRNDPPSRQPRAQNYRTAPERPNQLYSSAGQALSSNMYGNATGTGGVGVGPGSAFGQRYGWYRDLLERRVAEKWRTEEVDPRIQTAPPAIVTFVIYRNGSVRDVRILQSSGNYALDNSAKRAVYEAAPFPELPRDFDRDNAQIEFWFQLKR